MKKNALLIAVLCALGGTSAWAQSSDFASGSWLVRARAVHLDSANSDGTGLGLSINNRWLPELDVSYFFTPNISAELILTYPQRQSVYLNGASIGSFKHLPPTLTAQYHFTNLSGFKPYVGAGINYTRISSANVLNGGADLSRNSFGPALQVGVDIPLAKNLYLNLDLKKVWIKSTVSIGGADKGSFKVNPTLFGIGLGYRF